MAPVSSRMQLLCLDDVDVTEVSDDMDAEVDAHTSDAWDLIANEAASRNILRTEGVERLDVLWSA